MNQFAERYRSTSNLDLLRIIENSDNYQPEAVEAAKNEINQRQLTDQELTEAQQELETERQEKIRQGEKRTEVENRVKKLGTSIFDTINPIQQSAPTPERLIRLITIVFGLISIYQLYEQLSMLQFIFNDSGGEWDLSMVLFFVPLLLLPVATILFWFRKKVGWIFLGAFLTYSAINVIGLLIMTWNMEPLGVPAIDSLFPQTSTATYILTFLFFGGTLWVLSKENIREQFNINRQTMLGTIGITTLLTVLIIAPYF